MKFIVVFILFRTKDYEKSLNELKSEFIYRSNTFKFEINEKRFEKLNKTVDGMTFRYSTLFKLLNKLI
jgi:hypothetical protein